MLSYEYFMFIFYIICFNKEIRRGSFFNYLMLEIFERLPPKSIIRFRSLSKYWHSRLATPEFIRNHRLRCSKNPPKLLIRRGFFAENNESSKTSIYALHPGDQLPLHIPGYRYLSIPKVEFPCSLMPTMSPNQFSVVGSCNGILCLRDNENISLWNLSIRRRVRVPTAKSSFIFIEAAGFGFDPITDDYKIVAIYFYKLEMDMYVESLELVDKESATACGKTVYS
ncbi:putative F-box domain-containing protein [Helianthus annuus]|nr:putative F-box domain-containing protein [Helianthus annuus]